MTRAVSRMPLPGCEYLETERSSRKTFQGFPIFSREGAFVERIQAVPGAGEDADEDFPGHAPTAVQHLIYAC
jgi:hypothetical protein